MRSTSNSMRKFLKHINHADALDSNIMVAMKQQQTYLSHGKISSRVILRKYGSNQSAITLLDKWTKPFLLQTDMQNNLLANCRLSYNLKYLTAKYFQQLIMEMNFYPLVRKLMYWKEFNSYT